MHHGGLGAATSDVTAQLRAIIPSPPLPPTNVDHLHGSGIHGGQE